MKVQVRPSEETSSPSTICRCGSSLLVDAVERVPDQRRGVAHDILRAPDRIEVGEIGLRHELQRLGRALRRRPVRPIRPMAASAPTLSDGFQKGSAIHRVVLPLDKGRLDRVVAPPRECQLQVAALPCPSPSIVQRTLRAAPWPYVKAARLGRVPGNWAGGIAPIEFRRLGRQRARHPTELSERVTIPCMWSLCVAPQRGRSRLWRTTMPLVAFLNTARWVTAQFPAQGHSDPMLATR